jgi:plastocyanin
MSRLIILAVVILAGILAFSLLKSSAPHQVSAVNTVTVTAKDYSFDAPDSIPAGVTTFRLVNQGHEVHHLTLLKLGDAHTLADLQAALQQPGPLPTWATEEGGPNAVIPGDSTSATLNLEAGQYVPICVIPSPDGTPHFAKGMVRSLAVIPSVRAAAAEPAADITLTLRDYGFDLSKPITAGHHVIRVENAGPQDHEVVFFQLVPGKTAQDVVAFFEGGQKGSPPGKPIGGVTAMAVGLHTTITLDFSPGDYAMICFVPDAQDGKPHAAHGMMQTITVK